MTDVRTLLRNERTSRRIIDPDVSYSSTGQPICMICHIQLKSESLWDSHLRSSQHSTNLRRTRNGSQIRSETETNSSNGGARKKRKIEEVEADEKRKKSRSLKGLPEGFLIEETVTQDVVQDVDETHETAPTATDTKGTSDETPQAMDRPDVQDYTDKTNGQSNIPEGVFDATSNPAPTQSTPIDEDEWAAFEREVASPTHQKSIPSALNAEATISAAPLSAAELATQATADNTSLTEEELEGEKEDAARHLEEEFDEMEELEDRLRKLKEKREELRLKTEHREGGGVPAAVGESPEADNGSESDEYDDGEDWNNWRFR